MAKPAVKIVPIRPPPSPDVARQLGRFDGSPRALVAGGVGVKPERARTIEEADDAFHEEQAARFSGNACYKALNEAARQAGLRGFIVDEKDGLFSFTLARSGYAVSSRKSFEAMEAARAEAAEIVSKGAYFYCLRLAEAGVASAERREFARLFKPKSAGEVGVLHASRTVLEAIAPESDAKETIPSVSNRALKNYLLLAEVFGAVAMGRSTPAFFSNNASYAFLSRDAAAGLDRELAELLKQPNFTRLNGRLEKIAPISAEEVVKLMEEVTKNGFDEKTKALVSVPDGCKVDRSAIGFTASLGEGASAQAIAACLAQGGAVPSDACGYSLSVYDSGQQTHFVLVDRNRKIAVRQVLLTQGEGSWKKVADAIEQAIVAAQKETAKRTLFSFIVNDNEAITRQA